jgi:predicted ATP-grasp superfamily ATP-dependent carboligase/peptidoglycan/xylan/chitin deacetylase (PgdA/CDA1 family)
MTTLPGAIHRLRTAPGVVLGLGQNGLATVRALGRAGVPVIGLDANLDQPTARSRFSIPVACGDVRSEEGLLGTLLDLGSALPHKGVLFPSGDLNLLVVSEHRGRLAPYYHFALPDHDIVRLVLDKQAFYQWADQHGFAIPRTSVLGAEDPRTLSRELRYPLLVKPHLRDAGWRGKHGVKLYEVHSEDELLRVVDALAVDHPQLLLQECVPGAEDQLVFSLTYLDPRLEPLGMFTGRKLRQFPPRFGTSSMAESCWDPEVAQRSLAVLRALRYCGYGSVEFKRDPRDGTLRIIEVTGRTWYPHGLATACGINLPYLAYQHLLGRPVERPTRFVSGVKWIDEDRDLRAALRWRAEGRFDPRAWLASYRGRRVWAISAADDPRPGLHLARAWTKSALRAIRTRRWAGLKSAALRRAKVEAATTPSAASVRAPEVITPEERLRAVLQRSFYVAKRVGVPGLDFGDRRHAAILRYHSISDGGVANDLYVSPAVCHSAAVFERHVAMLARRYRCVTMDDVLDSLTGGRSLPAGAVVLTFDDGYRDNYSLAFPILRRHGVPATFYVTTGCLDGVEPLWTSHIRYIVQLTDRAALTEPVTGTRLGLENKAARASALRYLKTTFDGLTRVERAAALGELTRQAGVDLAPLREKFLRWSEVEEMQRHGMVIGSHTVSHPRLPAVSNDEARREIAVSRAELAAGLRREVRHFAYPNPGDRTHHTTALRALVAHSGYATAVTSEQSYVRDGDDPLELGRLNVGVGDFRIPWDVERDILRTMPWLLPSRRPAPARVRPATELARDAHLTFMARRVQAVLSRLGTVERDAIRQLLRQQASVLRELRLALEGKGGP